MTGPTIGKEKYAIQRPLCVVRVGVIRAILDSSQQPRGPIKGRMSPIMSVRCLMYIRKGSSRLRKDEKGCCCLSRKTNTITKREERGGEKAEAEAKGMK